MSTLFKNKKETLDSVKTIAIAIFVALIFRFSVAAPYKIPTGSMIPTLKIGDFIFVSKLSYGIKLPFTNMNLIEHHRPKRGEVIVFIYPEEPDKDFIKRVVGIEGDTVEIKDDILYVNNQSMPRTQIQDRSIIADLTPSSMREAARLYKENLSGVNHIVMKIFPFPDNYGPVVIPKDHVLVMGDNRDNSKDGRVWGFLPIKNIRGKALFIWLSLDTDNWRIRWERFGMKII